MTSTSALIDWMVDEFKKSNGIDLSNDRMAMQRLKEAAEKAKIELSGMTQTLNVNLPFITADATGPKHLEHDPDPCKVQRADRRPRRAHHGPDDVRL